MKSESLASCCGRANISGGSQIAWINVECSGDSLSVAVHSKVFAVLRDSCRSSVTNLLLGGNWRDSERIETAALPKNLFIFVLIYSLFIGQVTPFIAIIQYCPSFIDQDSRTTTQYSRSINWPLLREVDLQRNWVHNCNAVQRDNRPFRIRNRSQTLALKMRELHMYRWRTFESVWSELLKKDPSGHLNLWKAPNYDLTFSKTGVPADLDPSRFEPSGPNTASGLTFTECSVKVCRFLLLSPLHWKWSHHDVMQLECAHRLGSFRVKGFVLRGWNFSPWGHPHAPLAFSSILTLAINWFY